MKNKLIQIVYVALCCMAAMMISLCMTSCDEGGIDSQINGDLRVGITAQASYAVSASAATIKFNVTSNTPWEISSDQAWCTVTPVSSTVSALVQEITIETEVNPDAKPRTALVTIKGEKVSDQVITVVQDAKAELNVAAIDETDLFARDGASKAFTVLSNKAWTVVSDKAWLTFDMNGGEGGDEAYRIVATAVENTGNQRSATVSVKTNLETYEFVVVQEGNLLEASDISDTTYTSAAEAKTYQVNANLAWVVEIEEGCDWIHVDRALGEGSGNLVVSVDANDVACGPRWGKITLRPQATIPGLENVVIPVYQIGNHNSAGNVTFHPDGSVSIVSEGGTDRMVTKDPMKLGTYIWKFSAFNIPEGSSACFDLNAWPDVSPSTANFHIYLGPTNHQFTCGGGFEWQAAANIDVSNLNFSELRELKLDIDHDPEHEGRLVFTLYFNGQVIFVQKNKANPFTNPAEIGIPYYYGFAGSGAASCTIDSFTIIPRD